MANSEDNNFQSANGKENIEHNTNRNKDNSSQEKDPGFLERTRHWITLVDDEESIRLALGDYLYSSGYAVSACADATALLQLLSTPHPSTQTLRMPSLIITDIRMPGCTYDGLDLVHILKSKESRWRGVPILIVSAKSLTQDRIRGYKAGADGYLPKPFDAEELLAMVDSLIRRDAQLRSDGGKGSKLRDLQIEMGTVKDILKRGTRPGGPVIGGGNVINALPSSSKQSTLGKTSSAITTTGNNSSIKINLTPSEKQVLELLCKGFSNGEIAKERGSTSAVGVGRIVSRLYDKSGAKTRTELLRWALKMGYVST